MLIDQGSKGLTPRLIRIDPTTGRILAEQVLPPESLTKTTRFTMFAIHGQMAYLADEGSASLTMLIWHVIRRHVFLPAIPPHEAIYHSP